MHLALPFRASLLTLCAAASVGSSVLTRGDSSVALDARAHASSTHVPSLHAPSMHSFADATDERFPDGDTLVKASLLCDRTSVRAGETFQLAVRYTIAPKWHVYWENPGDAGQAARATFKAPTGFEIGPPRFPTPVRHEAEGDIVTFVHEKELVLLFDVKAPAQIAAGTSLEFGLDASWLVCEEMCVPGSGKDALTLTVASAEPVLANEALFTAARARLPRPASELEGATFKWSGDDDAPHVAVTVNGATSVELFPYRSDALFLRSRTVAADAGGANWNGTFGFRPKDDAAQAPRLRGIVRVDTARGSSSYVVDQARPVPLPNGSKNTK